MVAALSQGGLCLARLPPLAWPEKGPTMTALTPTDKRHWHDRLAFLIDRALAQLAADDPGRLRRLRREARRRAWQSLGLAELQAQSVALAAQQEELSDHRRRLHRAMLAVVRRLPVDEVAEAPDTLPATTGTSSTAASQTGMVGTCRRRRRRTRHAVALVAA